MQRVSVKTYIQFMKQPTPQRTVIQDFSSSVGIADLVLERLVCIIRGYINFLLRAREESLNTILRKN